MPTPSKAAADASARAQDTSAREDERARLARWVAQAQRGDPQAQRALFDRLYPEVMAYCLTATRRDRAQAKDLAQEVFARFFRHLPKLDAPERVRAWTYTIAANVCRDHHAKTARQRHMLAAFTLAVEAEPAPQDHALRQARVEAVRRALEGIPDPTTRQIALLKYTDPEHTTRQIAARLGVPHGTVTSKLMRFRARFKARLVRALDAIDAPF